MKLWPFSRGTEYRASYSVGDPSLAYVLGYSLPGDEIVTERTALTLSAVFRASNIVANSVALLKLKTLTEENGISVESTSFLDAPGVAVARDGVRYTPFEWKQTITLHMLFHGACYLQHIYNRAGALVALNPVHPLQVQPEWNSAAVGGKTFWVSQYADKGDVEIGRHAFDGSNMTQIMSMSFDGLCGIGIIGQARMSFGTALAGDKSANRLFKNGAQIAGMVTPAEDGDLNEADAKKIKEHINHVIAGPENAGDIPVINRKLNFTPWTMNAVDSQHLESRTFSIDEIGRWFGVPPHLLGLTEKATSWGQGIAEQNRGLARYTLSGITTPQEERLSTLIPANKWVEYDYSSFIRPSPEDEINLLISQVNSGLLTLNEARAIRNMAPLPGGDLPRTPPGSAPPVVDPNQPAIEGPTDEPA